MPVPTHFKFTARGEFTGTPETWSFGFHMTRAFAGVADVSVDNIDQGAVTDAFSALFSNVNTSTLVKMTDWRCYQIGTNGRTEPDSDILRVDVTDTPIVGAAANKYPPQIAVAVSLIADNRGPASHGRFYLPGPAFSITEEMRITEASADAIAEGVTDFLKAVSDAIDVAGITASVAGCNVSSRGGPDGTLQEIDHVEVGRALDTLRSRRTSLLEERHVHGHIDW